MIAIALALAASTCHSGGKQIPCSIISHNQTGGIIAGSIGDVVMDEHGKATIVGVAPWLTLKEMDKIAEPICSLPGDDFEAALKRHDLDEGEQQSVRLLCIYFLKGQLHELETILDMKKRKTP